MFSWCGSAFRNVGSVNVHKFITTRHLSNKSVNTYKCVTFALQLHADIDGEIVEARRLVTSEEFLHVPVALPPPRALLVRTLVKERFHGTIMVLGKLSFSSIFIYAKVRVIL